LTSADEIPSQINLSYTIRFEIVSKRKIIKQRFYLINVSACFILQIVSLLL